MTLEISELTLLKAASKRDNFDRFKKFLKSNSVSEETKVLLADMETYLVADPSRVEVDWPGFEAWFFLVRHKSMAKTKADGFKKIIERLSAPSAAPINDQAVLDHFTDLHYSARVLDVCHDVIENGKGKLSDIDKIMAEYMLEKGNADRGRAKYLKSSFGESVASVYRPDGLEWPLACLNKGVGPVNPGDFIIFVSRPEAGKTSWALHTVSHWMKQTDGNLLIINNEERGAKIKARFAQCCLDKMATDLEEMDPADVDKDIAARIGSTDRVVLLESDYVSVSDVERAVAEVQPKFIVFNVLDKVTGFEEAKGNDVARLRRLFQWGRALAARGIVVIALAQAGEEAEGVQWITQNMIYGSKTGAAGEADLIITMGKKNEAGSASKRFIHTPKNKLPGGKGSDPKERHGYHIVEFEQETGQFDG